MHTPTVAIRGKMIPLFSSLPFLLAGVFFYFFLNVAWPAVNYVLETSLTVTSKAPTHLQLSTSGADR